MTSTHASSRKPAAHCTIVPPYILEALAAGGEPALAARAREALRHDEQVRAARRTPTAQPTTRRAPRREDVTATGAAAALGSGPQRTVYDAKGTQTTPGTK